MKKTLLIISFLTLTATFSFAQDKAYKDAVKKMFSLNGSESTFKAVFSQMTMIIKKQMPKVPESFWKEMSVEMEKTSMKELLDSLIPVYQNHLTLSDINQLIAFYESPIGKKFAQKTPLITQESMLIGQQWGMKIGQKIAKKAKEKYN